MTDSSFLRRLHIETELSGHKSIMINVRISTLHTNNLFHLCKCFAAYKYFSRNVFSISECIVWAIGKTQGEEFTSQPECFCLKCKRSIRQLLEYGKYGARLKYWP